MKLKDIIFYQIQHKETDVVPYTLRFDRSSEKLIDEFYGGTDWRQLIIPYIKKVWAVDNQYKTAIDAAHTKDIYGSIWRDDGKAAHLVKPVMDDCDFNKLKLPPMEEFLKNNEYENAKNEIEKFDSSFRIVHIPWGLFERSWALRGFEDALMDMVANQSFYEELLDRITDHLMQFVNLALQLPVDGIMFGDDWGGQRGLFMGADRWRSLFKIRYKRLFDAVHDKGKIVLTHCCGNIVEIMPDVIEIGLDVYESFQPEVMDIYEVKKQWGNKITFWGGLGAQSIIPFGTPDDIRKEVRKLKDNLSKGGGFILAPSKEPPEETPVENLVALIESFNDN